MKTKRLTESAMLLALAVGGVAYTVRRGVLNFTEDFGFAPMVSQEGAERLVTSGSLAHIELERTIIDVREAVYDGNVLQAVVAVQGKENRRAVMLGDDGNVSADAVLVDVGEDGEIETAREEDGVLLVYKKKAVGAYLLERPSGVVVGLKDMQAAMAEAEAQQTSGEDYSGDWGERHDEELTDEAQQTSGEDYSGDWGERHDEELDAQQTSGEPDAAPQAVPYTELPLDAEGYPVE